MIDFFRVILIFYGLIQGVSSAYMLATDSSQESSDIQEAKESFQMMGLHSFSQQKQLLMNTFHLGTVLRFLFSIPAFIYFILIEGRLGLLITGILLLFDIIKTLRNYRQLEKSKSIEPIFKNKLSSKVIHVVRLILKALTIALLLSKGA